MPGKRRQKIAIALIAAAAAFCGAAATAETLPAANYTAEQAKRGETVYAERCAACHGDQLDNGQFAAPLRGEAFAAHWGAGSLAEPFEFMTAQMPPDNPGNLTPDVYADLMAYILSKNGVPATATPLPADLAQLKLMAAPQ